MSNDRATSDRLWSGRFTERPDATAEAFTASIPFDNRLARQDIRGSIAHVRMLARQQIIDAAAGEAIERGLWTILDEVDRGVFAFQLSDEDIHTAVERRLRELIGPDQGKLHTARSRNDQVATDTRLWCKSAILDLVHRLSALFQALAEQARRHRETVMPGYTHTQRAQPILLAHHLLAYGEMLERDAERLQQAFDRVDVLPLGSGALAGVTYPIDRESVARELGFARITRNSMDAIADRDYVVDILSACALVQMHISRLCEEFVVWSSGEFRFVECADAFATGSSIMPQKKNPDVAELARGKTGRVYGHLLGTLTMLKGLPLTYNSDMQEDKEALFSTVDTVTQVLDVVAGMVRTARFDEERMAAAAAGDFSLATDAADLLVRHGVAFRDAHEVVGRLVRFCIDHGKTFADLTHDEWAAAHPVFAAERPPLHPIESIDARDVPGGTARERVAAALEDAVERWRVVDAWTAEQREALRAVMRPPGEVAS